MLRKSMLAVAGALLLSSGFAINSAAAATLFTITSVSFTFGSGYGDDASETPSNNPTLLDVEFDTSGFVAQNFTLTNPGDFQIFLFGTVDFQEPATGGGIQPAETDNLGVTAHFVFTSPTGSTQDVIAVGTAVAGSVPDVFVDYALVWTPTIVSFGTGGSFKIELANLSFSDQGKQNENATITLITPSQVNGAPEPATLSLLGLGLAGLGVFARKRKRPA